MRIPTVQSLTPGLCSHLHQAEQSSQDDPLTEAYTKPSALTALAPIHSYAMGPSSGASPCPILGAGLAHLLNTS